jgi:hypothetical protein
VAAGLMFSVFTKFKISWSKGTKAERFAAASYVLSVSSTLFRAVAEALMSKKLRNSNVEWQRNDVLVHDQANFVLQNLYKISAHLQTGRSAWWSS